MIKIAFVEGTMSKKYKRIPSTQTEGSMAKQVMKGRPLPAVGIKVNLCQDSHLCCGSAGTYSILQEKLSTQLKEQKLENLLSASQQYQASSIVSGNVGCITQLQNEAMTVKHWIEILDDLLV